MRRCGLASPRLPCKAVRRLLKNYARSYHVTQQFHLWDIPTKRMQADSLPSEPPGKPQPFPTGHPPKKQRQRLQRAFAHHLQQHNDRSQNWGSPSVHGRGDGEHSVVPTHKGTLSSLQEAFGSLPQHG